MKKSSIEEFKHKYYLRFPTSKIIFDKAEYINSHTLMTCTCPIHGDFTMRPSDLLHGSSCPTCGGTKKMNTEEYIIKANKVHNNFFIYDKTLYSKANSKIIVTCPIHGDFIIRANNHLQGGNCPLCNKEGINHVITKQPKINKSTKKLSQEEFEERINKLYGDKYIVIDKTRYISANKKVTLLCQEHGEFEITPNHLFNGGGCPICSKNKKKSRNEIIEMIKKVHPLSDFDFSHVKYVNTHTPITLKCNTCNFIFSNSPSNIIHYKQGCPCCKQSQLEKKVEILLQTHDINYEKQKQFEWLIHKRNLKLDFYLPEYRIAIECQGIQHFKEVNVFGGVENFERVKFLDTLKKELCNKNNIDILYYSELDIEYPYHVITDMNFLLDNILKRKIK